MKSNTNVIYISLIILLLTIVFIFSYGNITSVYSDTGREFYIPWQMNCGEVLYKDILNVYAPLGYQINAIIIKLFNYKMISLYITGYLLSLFSLIAFYFISKIFSDKIYALVLSVLIMFCCCFYQSISNYITPYSYSILYAMSAFLWSLLMLLLFLKTNKNKFYIFSCLLMGFSAASKYEYALFIVILVLCAIYKKLKLKDIILSLGAFSIIPLFSLILLIKQGCSIQDLIISIQYIFQLAKTNAVNYFYTFTGFIPSKTALLRNFFSFLFFCIFFSITFFIPYFILTLLKNKGIKTKISAVIIILFPVLFFFKDVFAMNNSIFFSFIGVFIVSSFIFITIKNIKNKENNEKNIFLYVLLLTAILSSIKVLNSISLELYGTFFLPILLISFTALFYKDKSSNQKIYISFLCFLLSVTYMYVYIDTVKIIQYKPNIIKTSQNENIYTNNSYFSNRYNELISYINNNTKKDDTVLILPEGTLLNYITRRKSNNMYYYLIPPNVEMFSQKKIIKEIENNPPEIIIVFYNTYKWYNTTSFSYGYGSEIMKCIEQNYTVDSKYSTKYDKIYKLNDKQNSIKWNIK